MNQELSKIFHEIAVFLDMKGTQFKPRAYEKVAEAIGDLEEDVSDIYKKDGLNGLRKIPGVGESIAKKIEEFIETGKIKEHQLLFKERPLDLKSLSRIEGLGPKSILKLNEKLGITNLADLEKAAKEGKISKLPGFGKKSEEKILKSIELQKQGSARLTLGFQMAYFRKILERIKKVPGVKAAEFAGSVRRMQESIGDLDILVISNKPEAVNKYFISMPDVIAVHSQGETRSSVRLRIGIDADLRVLPSESFGAAQQYFTGDKYHNIKLRQIAIGKGYKLNEYGLFKGKKAVAGKDEKEVYAKLGLEWMPPEIRNNAGEIEAAQKGTLPQLVGYKDIRGDLQVHSTWTDGHNSVREMAQAAHSFGLEYICITDHTKSLTITGGNNEEEIIEQIAEIEEVQKEFKDFKILKGAEVNILKDGTLDIADEVLAKLDIVGVAVHSHFGLSSFEMTDRIIKAISNPHADILFHPTGRLLHKRKPYEFDFEEVLKIAKQTGTILEIDAFPDRLDLDSQHARKAIEAGIKLSMGSDAHHTRHFEYLEFGVAQARRAWAEKKDIITTYPWQQMIKLLKNGK